MNEMSLGYKPVVEEISNFSWEALSEADLSAVARAYYYFSIQFRENLQIAHHLYPADPLLPELVQEECDTANLSPWPGVAAENEKLDHDEFMRRVLLLSAVDSQTQGLVDAAGHDYLAKSRSVDNRTRALSIATYEDGGLESVFTAMLRAKHWNTPLLQGFRHFLIKHVAFDSDPDGGHGGMVRHMASEDGVRYLWIDFRDLLITSVPRLAL